jgi:AmmeMemoRadiSam system protein B
MSLVFAAIVPHAPLLIPSIGKEAIKKIDKTKRALEKLEEDLYLSHPDTIIIFSPHSHLLKDAFTINISPEHQSDLREFGDLATKLTVKGELNLMSQLRKAAEEQKITTKMITEAPMDHGLTIPLFYLMPHLPNVTVLPIGFCDADPKTHLEFGSLLKDQIMNSTKRVAVIASGDLSHALTTDAPAGFNPAGPEFDAKIQELLAAQNTTGILQLDPEMVKNSAECGFRTFLMLMGVLRGVHYTYQSYAYEAPFGVGYLTANFAI